MSLLSEGLAFTVLGHLKRSLHAFKFARPRLRLNYLTLFIPGVSIMRALLRLFLMYHQIIHWQHLVISEHADKIFGRSSSCAGRVVFLPYLMPRRRLFFHGACRVPGATPSYYHRKEL